MNIRISHSLSTKYTSDFSLLKRFQEAPSTNIIRDMSLRLSKVIYIYIHTTNTRVSYYQIRVLSKYGAKRKEEENKLQKKEEYNTFLPT